MNTIAYLKEVYGYDNPIILKNIRIGGRSKTAIRQDLSRACKRGELSRYSNGTYYFNSNKISAITGLYLPSVTFEDYITQKYIKDTEIAIPDYIVYGYYSGQTFLNQIGISDQVPGKKEITTNNTSSKKRTILINNRYAIIRKGRVEINRNNWKILQFLDMFHFLNDEDFKKNKKLLVEYIEKMNLSKIDLQKYIKYYSIKTMKMIFESELVHSFK